jgi:hypothetical protein
MKINNLHNQTLQQVYKDAKGNLWFAHKNPLDLSAVRGIEAATADRYIGMMISKKELELAFEAHRKAAKDLDVVTCFAIVADLEHRSKFLCEANSILDLAGIYYFLQDEDPNSRAELNADRKQKIWEQDEACRSFFLRMGLGLTEQFPNTSDEDLLKFMEEAKSFTERIYRYIPKPTKRLTNSTTT